MNQEEVYNKTLEYYEGDILATESWINKYALRDNDSNLVESTPDNMHRRLAKEFARIEQNYSNPLTEEEIYSYFKDFNSIVPQGSPMYGIGNNTSLMSLSNCVVVAPPKDSVSGIINTSRDLANLYKNRCGVGTDISTLRPEGERVNNSAGTTTGAWSFADFYSYVTNMIGQNGRRSALMLTMDVSHPDIEKFITMKTDLSKVTGANITVKLSDKFMNAVFADKMFDLVFDGKVYKTVNARSLFKLIGETATTTGEPGVSFWDRILEDNPLQCYKDDGFNHVGLNPCGELSLSPDDSCRLIAINLVNFVLNAFSVKDAVFDMTSFERTIRVATRLSDDLIDLEVEKLNKIINHASEQDVKDVFIRLRDTALKGRRTGLGVFGLADMLAKLTLKYDSQEAIDFVEHMMNSFKNTAYSESTRLAKERGPFPIWNWEKEKNNKFINSLDNDVIEEIKTYGRRSGASLTCAPNGTSAIVSRVSSGIEPMFRFSYTRRRKLNENEKDIRADFVDDSGIRWKEHKYVHPLIEKYMRDFGIKEEKDLPEFFTTSDKIDYTQRIKMQEALQKGIDHQISSTINLPKGTKSDVVCDIYEKAYEHNLKGLTVYVDGSRANVLVDNTTASDVNQDRFSPDRPKELPCNIFQTVVSGKPYIFFVGLYDGKPFELFGGEQKKIRLPKRYESGTIIKHERKTVRNKYDLVLTEKNCKENGTDCDEMVISDIVNQFDNGINLAFARIISTSLRHKVPVKFIVEQLQKETGNMDNDGLHSFNKGAARALKPYILDNEGANGVCEECGSTNLRYEGGCIICECGSSKCG
jgi:ribonucleoside-diphosphate reductase alpha chain